MGIPEYLYYIGLSAKKAWSLKHQRELPCRVISIGNITVGGTGKTPATIALTDEAKKRGFRPIILTRGYKGSAKGPCFVTLGDGPILNPEESGDEPALMGFQAPIADCNFLTKVFLENCDREGIFKAHEEGV